MSDPHETPAPPAGPPYGPPPPYGQSPYGQSPYPAAPPYASAPRSQRGLAIAALVLSFLMCGLISFVMALVAFVRATPGPGSGRVVAAVAMVTSLVLPAVLVGGVYLFGGQVQGLFEPQRDSSGQVTSSGRLDKDELRVGDCVNDPQLAALDEGESTEQASPSVEVLPCDEPHDMEVIATFPQRAKDAPSAKVTLRTCWRRAAREFDGNLAALQPLGLSTYANATATGQVVCLGYLTNGERLTAPLQ